MVNGCENEVRGSTPSAGSCAVSLSNDQFRLLGGRRVAHTRDNLPQVVAQIRALASAATTTTRMRVGFLRVIHSHVGKVSPGVGLPEQQRRESSLASGIIPWSTDREALRLRGGSPANPTYRTGFMQVSLNKRSPQR
jgi:hypothetical protein